jgi:NAD-dependent deacetylase
MPSCEASEQTISLLQQRATSAVNYGAVALVLQEKMVDSQLIKRAAEKFALASSVVVLTGAGISKESGIPTFRDAQTGLWSKYNPEELATPQGFKQDPKLVWQWYDYRRKLVQAAKPNAGHQALVKLESLLPTVIVTQNVDGLHVRAGSTDVIELHGSILRFFCFDNQHPADNIAVGLDQPPRCICGSFIRPAVVWFHEALPQEAFSRASQLMKEADVVLVVGTSGLVQPAASLPLVAKQHGAFLVEVNPERTPIGELADIFLCGAAGDVLPPLVHATGDMH